MSYLWEFLWCLVIGVWFGWLLARGIVKIGDLEQELRWLQGRRTMAEVIDDAHRWIVWRMGENVFWWIWGFLVVLLAITWLVAKVWGK